MALVVDSPAQVLEQEVEMDRLVPSLLDLSDQEEVMAQPKFSHLVEDLVLTIGLVLSVSLRGLYQLLAVALWEFHLSQVPLLQTLMVRKLARRRQQLL